MLLNAHVDKNIEAVVSQEVLKELVRNIKKKFPSAFRSVQDFFKSTPPVIIKDPTKISPQIESLVHLKDGLIFQSAFNAKIKIFVTGNVKDFSVTKIKKVTGIEVLTPKQAVDILQLNNLSRTSKDEESWEKLTKRLS